ncbi:Adenylate kinase 7 [Myotis brandtii]|uniref:Adenylate kinase 7 n=1 Tax=Myotis brandtii TaxID=109478 RepID=S7PLV5_MYOBR|nr:Adenylate kinase 7 [Myotis brandtii]
MAQETTLAHVVRTRLHSLENRRLEEVKREETELLEAQSAPLRNYLMTYVMPTLMQGLNECCKVRPEDPVDFLAEYLFKHNPAML